MNILDVYGELGDALDTITGLRVHPFPANKVTPPAALLMLPEPYTFDETYGRGSDKFTVPVVLLVGKASDRASFKELAAYCDGSGAKSVKAAIDGRTYSACDTVRVASVDFDVATIAAVDYLAATFPVEITGSGS